MEKDNKNYIVQSISSSMFSKVSNGEYYLYPVRNLMKYDDLKNIENLRSSITNKGLLGTLREDGIDVTLVTGNRFFVNPGDTVFVLIPFPRVELKDYKNLNRLPDDIELQVEVWKIIKK
jgi:hypothetical protein